MPAPRSTTYSPSTCRRRAARLSLNRRESHDGRIGSSSDTCRSLRRSDLSHERTSPMTSQLLGRTHHSEIESRTASGLPIYEMLSQIRLELGQRLGAEHALLFAEPNANPETGYIQWYAPLDGTPRRLDE